MKEVRMWEMTSIIRDFTSHASNEQMKETWAVGRGNDTLETALGKFSARTLWELIDFE